MSLALTPSTSLPPLTIGRWTLPVPVIQGGMGVRVSAHGLASAVAQEGGAGIIASVALGLGSRHFHTSGDFYKANRLALVDELRWARALSPEGILGVNCMVAVRDFATLVRTAVRHGAQLVICGAGLPLGLPDLTKERPEAALIPIVSSLRAAKIIARRWWSHAKRLPDAIVFEDPNKAGGHLGARREEIGDAKYSAERVVPELAAWSRESYAGEIPIVLAGGVWDRADIDRALDLGASGVQMASRFICTEECDADDAYKQAFIDAKEGETEIVDSPAGLPGRALSSAFMKRLHSGGAFARECAVSCLERCGCRDEGGRFCIAEALHHARLGRLARGLVFSGTNGPRHRAIVKVRDVFDELLGRAAPQGLRAVQA